MSPDHPPRHTRGPLDGFTRPHGGIRWDGHGPAPTAANVARRPLLLVGVFTTGIGLWLFGTRLGFAWVPLHHGLAYLWFVAMAVHVIAYLRRAPELAVADWRDHLRGALTRRALVLGSLVLGAALEVAMLPFPTPFAFGALPGG